VLPTNENLMIARHTLKQVMFSSGGGGLSASQVPH
jgi:hypothetical protein